MLQRSLIVLLAVTRLCSSTLLIVRGVDEASIDANGELISSSPEWCEFAPDRVITFSHPQSIHYTDKYYGMGSLSLEAVAITADYINTERCGVHIQGQNYSVSIRTYSDNSDKVKHETIGRYIVNRTDFMLAGYSSGLTSTISPIAQEYNRVLVAGGASSTSVFENNPFVFGILPRSDTFLEQAFKGLALQGARTVLSLHEDGEPTCTSVSQMAEKYGLELLGERVVSESPKSTEFLAAASNISQLDPDLMVTCVYDYGCADWIKAMRSVGWSPRAQVFTMCIGTPELELPAGSDVAYMMGATSWNRVIAPIKDGATGWTPAEFAGIFELATFRNATYQHTAAATSLSVIVQAIERANSIESELVREEIQSGVFNTVYGETSFDKNGQNEVVSSLMQYDSKGTLHVVFPLEKKSPTSIDIIYPMPNWDHRDCLSSKRCGDSGGVCVTDGTCSCEQVEGAVLSFGSGSSAFCKEVPDSEMNYIDDVWIYVGIAFVSIQLVLSLATMIWTYVNRFKSIVSASQPEFLYLVSFGCLVMSLSIIPTMFQGGYRYESDPLTGKPTDVENPDMKGLDAACMAFPWLAGLGFAIVYSALFAKIWRVKKLLHHAEKFRRKVVEIKDVILIMVFMVSVEVIILLAWQLVDPLRWQRTILRSDEDGFPVESSGHCKSDHYTQFIIPLALFNGGSLIYALYLCWIERKVPSDFFEGTWVTLSVASIFQIMVIAVPVLSIASYDRNTSFFVTAGVIFLCSSTVTVLIFGPKIWKTLKPDRPLQVRQSQFHSGSGRFPPENTPSRSVFLSSAENSQYGLPVLNLEPFGGGPEERARSSSERESSDSEATVEIKSTEAADGIAPIAVDVKSSEQDEDSLYLSCIHQVPQPQDDSGGENASTDESQHGSLSSSYVSNIDRVLLSMDRCVSPTKV